MSNVVCIRHPQYDGKVSPILSCVACCKIFLESIHEVDQNGVSLNENKERCEYDVVHYMGFDTPKGDK